MKNLDYPDLIIMGSPPILFLALSMMNFPIFLTLIAFLLLWMTMCYSLIIANYNFNKRFESVTKCGASNAKLGEVIEYRRQNRETLRIETDKYVELYTIYYANHHLLPKEENDKVVKHLKRHFPAAYDENSNVKLIKEIENFRKIHSKDCI